MTLSSHVPMAEEKLLDLEALSEAATETERELLAELRWQRETTAAMVRALAINSSKCAGCGVEFWWVRSGKAKDAKGQLRVIPVTSFGKNHNAECPSRQVREEVAS